MPARKPLVLIAGTLQQLPATDYIDSPINLNTITNGTGSTIAIGTPICLSGGTFQLARANNIATSDVVGLVASASIAAAGTGDFRSDGNLVATTTQWDVVTGQTGGLTPGAIYYLSSASAGKLTTTAPTATGEVVARVGIALSATSLQLRLQPPILL